MSFESLLEGNVAPEWIPILKPAIGKLPEEYLSFLLADRGYIPPAKFIFRAFRNVTPSDLRYILFGQDPYPRTESATGYAFIDGRVKALFSDSGLSREVNRATSLRNFIKMALAADGLLSCDDLSQHAIASLSKTELIDSIDQLRINFESRGVLLLNMALIFTCKDDSAFHIRSWKVFVETFLDNIQPLRPTLILFGNHAKGIKDMIGDGAFQSVELEHPYNHSFVCNKKAHSLFGPMKLLRRERSLC